MGKASLFDLGPDGLNRLFALGQEEAEAGEKPEGEEVDLSSSAAVSTESIGSWVDRYKLVRVLGEGGMGIVYLAEQEHPINRQVALKVIKPGMDSRRVIACFEAERQTVARLDHPNIAHVHDAGTTTSGRPYFVMEYVEGLPVTEYCDRNKLSVNERLELFGQICQAVHHAHQKGFIHRDIKPSNILVTLQDGRPIPKVIDFGVARALSQPLAKETLFTQQGQLVGTPEYMSPEQIDLADEGADTRSDVYSLGVLLYVLLTGVLPFESDTLRGSGLEHLRKVIREQDPKTPSTRLTGLGDRATEVAVNRRTEVRALAHSLHKELEWIPLKAMRKEREQRYQSVGELIQDIGNYLARTPLIAGPPSVSYRLKKLIARNKALVVATVLVAITVSVGLIVSLTMYVRVQVQSERTQAVSNFLSTSVLGALDAYRTQGGEVTPVSVLDAVSEAIESRFDDVPLVQAKVRYGLGKAYWSHGQYDASVEHLKQAWGLQCQELGAGDLTTVATGFQLGVALLEAGRCREAEPVLLEVVAQRTRQLGETDRRTLWAMNILAREYMNLAEYAQAMRLSEDALGAARRAGDDENAEMAAHTIGLIHNEQGHYDDAERWLGRALQMAEHVRTEDHPVLGNIRCLLGSVYRAQGRYDEAQSLLNESLARANRIFGEDHWQTSTPLRELARLYVAWDKPEEAARWRAKLTTSNTTEMGSSSGSIRYDASDKAYVIHGSGMAIWDNFDEFCFAYKELSGDGSMTARIDSIEHVKGWTEAGIMIRNALEPTSEHASVTITVNGVIGFLHRAAARERTRSVSIYPRDFVFPHWIRLTRKGNTFTAEHANDGIAWKPVGTCGPNMPSSVEAPTSETVYVGLAASSHDPRRAAEARISNVSFTGNVSPGGPFTVSEDISLLTALSQTDRGRDRDE